jgi:Ca2+-binding EF-hand superfamily protein
MSAEDIELSDEVKEYIDEGVLTVPEDASLGELFLVFKELNGIQDKEDVMTECAQNDFEVFDTDDSGTIDVSELQNRLTEFLEKMGSTNTISEEFTQKLLAKFDTDDDQVLSPEEYTKLIIEFVKCAHEAYAHFYREAKNKAAESDAEMIFLDIPEGLSCSTLTRIRDDLKILCTDDSAVQTFAEEMFEAADEDGNQQIDSGELKSLFEKMAKDSGVEAEIPDSLVETYIAKLDKDDDGTISLDEFIPFAKDCSKQMHMLCEREIDRRKRRDIWKEDDEEEEGEAEEGEAKEGEGEGEQEAEEAAEGA